jgi:hypothetical protein
MLMPSPVVIQYRRIVAARAGQLKKNSAATAPRCKIAMTLVTVQFVFCWLNIRDLVAARNRPVANGSSIHQAISDWIGDL